VETARTATTRTGGELAREQRFRARRKSSRLFVAHLDPLDLAAIDGMGNAVEGVADDPVALFTPAACSVSTNTSATRLLIAQSPVLLRRVGELHSHRADLRS
jgi:hypothetical protein